MRFYSSTAAETTLTGGITNVSTVITVVATTGFPAQTPYTLILDEGTAAEELVEVSNVAGPSLTVTRGVDGTSALAHSTGAKVRHGVSARDFREPQEHIAASAGIHGVTGSVLGTTDTQTVSNKTVNSSTWNGGTIASATLTTPTIGDFTNAQHDHSAANKGGTALNAPTITGGTLAGTIGGTPTLSGSPVTFTGQLDGTRTGTQFCLAARTSGDANPRWGVRADGQVRFGDGTAATDVNLYRGGADQLKTDDALEVVGALTKGGNPVRVIKIESQNSKVTSTTVFGTTNVTVTSLSVTGDGSTKIKATISWPAVQTQASGVSNCAVYIFRGGTQIGRASVYANAGTTDVAGGSLSITDTPAAGANTYSFQVQRLGGDTGTTLFGSSASPCELIIEQFGA